MNSTEAKLKQYQDAIDASNIVSKTNIHGVITFVNDEFCKISGYSREELIGAPHSIVRHPDVSKDVFVNLWQTILDKRVYKGIVKNRAKNGTSFYLNATIIPILDENGDIEEFVAIRHDVTNVVTLNERLIVLKNELKELNNSLEEKVTEQTKELTILNRNLETRVAEEVAKNEEKSRIMFRQSRLASMGEMVANIAHQWRQPLSELSIDIFKMKQNIENFDKLNAAYEDAKAVIKNMSKTIDDFRNFYSSNKPMDSFLIKNSLLDAYTILKATFEQEGINLTLEADDEIFAHGNQSEMTQVFMNILGNAKDAFRINGTKDKNIKINIYKKDSFSYTEIQNNGSTISEDSIEKIFEPYFTTKHKYAGTGLGLYMCKMIIGHMCGEICVKNIENGVKFIIKLPLNKGGE